MLTQYELKVILIASGDQNMSFLYHFTAFAIFTQKKFSVKNQNLLEGIFTIIARIKMLKISCSFVILVFYRENFENLLDDAKFKTEIVLFSIDHENSIISTEHRDQVLPILMR